MWSSTRARPCPTEGFGRPPRALSAGRRRRRRRRRSGERQRSKPARRPCQRARGGAARRHPLSNGTRVTVRIPPSEGASSTRSATPGSSSAAAAWTPRRRARESARRKPPAHRRRRAAGASRGGRFDAVLTLGAVVPGPALQATRSDHLERPGRVRHIRANAPGAQCSAGRPDRVRDRSAGVSARLPPDRAPD